MSRDYINGMIWQGIPIATQVFVFWMLAQNMQPAIFGIWTLFLLIHFLKEAVQSAFSRNAFIKFYQQAEEDRRGVVVSTTIAIQLAINAITIPLLFVTSFFLTNDYHLLKVLFRWYFVLALSSTFYQFMQSLLSVHFDFNKLRISALLFASLWMLVVWFVQLSADGALLSLLLGQSLVCLTAGGYLLYQVRKKTPIAWPQKNMAKAIYGFGKYAMGTTLGSMLYQKTDLLIIGGFLGPGSVGIYSVATRLVNYLDFPINAIGTIIYPKIAAAQNREEQETNLNRSLALMIAMVLPIALVITPMSSTIIDIMAGKDFSQAAGLFAVLASTILVKPFGRISGITLDATGKSKTNFLIMSISLFLNVILNLLLINDFGLMGAALATVISTWVSVIIGQIYLQKLIPIKYSTITRMVWRNYQQVPGWSATLINSFFNLKK